MQHKRKMKNHRSTTTSFGIFLMTACDDIAFMGLFTHFTGYYKHISDVLTLTGNFTYFKIQPQGFRLGLEIGPDLAIPTEDGRDTELLCHYGLTAG